jgi:tetratricopeptide (TPR) repeat protein
MTGSHPLSCEAFEDAINEYADGALQGEDRVALERHLESCAGCRALAADVRAIRRTAGTLDRRVPPRAVWDRISAQITAPPATRTPLRRQWIAPLAAAAVIVLAVSAGFYFRGGGSRTAPAPVSSVPAHVEPAIAPAPGSTPGSGSADELARSVESEMQMAEAHYEKAIADLEKLAKSEEKTLDPQLAATLRKNLGVVDQAISESRAALRSQPDNQPAQQSLFDAFRDKLTLLQDTVALINEMRKGNQAEAARIAGGMNKM